jgi:hypothetical protein
MLGHQMSLLGQTRQFTPNFHDIKVWGCTFKWFFKEQLMFKRHILITRLLYVYMIITRRLCHVMRSTKWHKLPPQTLMVLGFMLLSELSMCIGHEFAHGFSFFMDCSSKCLDVLFPIAWMCESAESVKIYQSNQALFWNQANC